MRSPPVRRLVALRALKLGDFLTGIPALRALARVFPDHERILAAPQRFSELIAHTGFDRVAPTPDLGPLAPELEGMEVAVDLHGKGPLSQSLLLRAHPGRLISFRSCLPETDGSPPWRPDEHEVHRWCRMLVESGIPADPSRLLLREELIPSSGLGDLQDATLLHPGAASGARRWPLERFARVARAESEAGRRVVITGTGKEEGLAQEVADRAALPQRSVLAGATNLTRLAATVSEVGRVVCGDTGVAHLASATGTASVVLFGPVPPGEWGPPPNPRHIAIWAGQRGDPHAEDVDRGLLAISVEAVLEALDRLGRGDESATRPLRGAKRGTTAQSG